MIRLQVNDFSCIKTADFTVGKYNVLIGPQASGKSVISKLLYFFVETVFDMHEQVIENRSMEDYKEHIRNKLSAWFPVSAWGDKKFNLLFEMGDISIKITRNSRKDQINDNLRITPSAALKNHFVEVHDLVKKMRKDAQIGKQTTYQFYELDRQIKSLALDLLQQSTKDDFLQFQTFIPAGRSFFTNLGRTIMAFDQGSMFDPITLQFGRLYIAMQDASRANRILNSNARQEFDFNDIIGGAMVWENDKPFIKAHDGRLIPFSALSSGQQELLPLIAALQSLSTRQSRGQSPRPYLIYIEEPEAHLFPSAQSEVIEGLVSMIGSQARLRRLVLTTHSPYVLSKMNNLAKAGLLERDLPEKLGGRLDRIVKKKYRIQPGTLNAYAIIDGDLKNIVDEDGLIDGEYLDGISNKIGSEFSKLIDLEIDSHDTGEVC